MSESNVAGVVVNYNAREYLLDCVASLRSGGVGTVIVVDNASTDGSEEALAERFPDAKWLPTGGNLGYGAAVNAGAALAGEQFLLVCNPDVVVGEGAVGALAELLARRPDVAVVGPQIADANGRLYPSARHFPDLLEAIGHGIVGQFWPGNPFSRRYTMADWDHAGARDVDWISGSCFLARRESWEAVGGFDPSYFMYLEDVDLCWRLRRAGWAVTYEPRARVTHVQGVSADRHPYRMLLAHHVSMWRFAWRTTPERWLLAPVVPGLALRFVLTAGRRWLAGALAAAPAGERDPVSGRSLGEGPQAGRRAR